MRCQKEGLFGVAEKLPYEGPGLTSTLELLRVSPHLISNPSLEDHSPSVIGPGLTK